MEIKKDRLSVIGKLIGIYREEKRVKSLNDYTLSKFCEGICSVNTLKNIEIGNISRSEDVYILLLEKLGLKFQYVSYAVDSAIYDNLPLLYEAIEYFDNTKIDDITKRMLRVLEKVKNVVYYSEIYNIVSDVRNYYLKLIIISEEKYKLYDEINCIIDPLFLNAQILLMFSWVQKSYMNDVNMCQKFVEKYNVINNSMMAIRTIMAYYYALSIQYLPMKKLIEESEKILLKKENYARLIGVYSYAIVMMSYINPEQTKKYINKTEAILNEDGLPKYKLHEIHSFIGNALHHLKDYGNALKYYQKALEYDQNSHITDLIFMADCQNRLDMKIDIPVISNECLERNPYNIQMMYNYFMFTDLPSFAKENFLLKEIAPNLKNDDFTDVFKFELEKLVQETGHYKSLYTFNQILRVNEVSKL